MNEAKQTECYWICHGTVPPPPTLQIKMDGGAESREGAKGLGRAAKSSVNCSPSSCIKFKEGCKNYPLINCKQKEGRGWEAGEALVWHTWSAHWAKWCHPSRWTQQFTIYFLINQTGGCFSFYISDMCVCVFVCLQSQEDNSSALLLKERPKMASKLAANSSPTPTSKMCSA